MEAKKEFVECPKCHSSKNVIPIVFGRPNQRLIDEAQQGKVLLKGCEPCEESHYCKDCNKEFVAKNSYQ